MCVYVCAGMCMCVCVCNTYVHVHVCACVCMHVHACVCVRVHEVLQDVMQCCMFVCVRAVSSLQVKPDGTYIKPPTAKITYGTMSYVRAGIVIMSARSLAKTVTIATRYSVVRRQGQPDEG